jgi:hypothetical protein
MTNTITLTLPSGHVEHLTLDQWTSLRGNANRQLPGSGEGAGRPAQDRYTVDGSLAKPMTFRQAVKLAVQRFAGREYTSITRAEDGYGVARLTRDGWLGDMKTQAWKIEEQMRKGKS